MNSEMVKEDIVHGLGAAKAGMEVAAKATSSIQKDVSSPSLKDLLENGERQSKIWMTRVENAIDEVGETKKSKNEVMEAIFDVSKEVRRHAKTDETRDLGIIATGQIALHYWIATFGTLRAYSKQAGYQQTAEAMEACLEEAKATDKRHTDVAAEIMGVSAAQLHNSSNKTQSQTARQ